MRSILYGFMMFAAVACSGTDSAKTSTDTTTTVSTETTASQQTQTAEAPMTSAAPAEEKKENASMSYENKVAELHTTAGEIDIRFFPDVAPNHVKNFIDLAKSGFYDGVKFHRVIPGFMIQGGDPNTIAGNPATWGTGGSPNKLKAEFNKVSHKRGIVSMARSRDFDSASSQFFICVADATQLDGQYTVFGEVTKGMDVADKIVNAPRGQMDRPNEPVTITKVVIRDANDSEKGPTPK